MGRKLYVGNLAYSLNEDTLKELFSKAGTVTSVTLITDKYSGRLKGFGFVEMSTDEEAQKAIKELNGQTLAERQIVVNEARPPRKREGGYRDFGGGGGGSRGRRDRY